MSGDNPEELINSLKETIGKVLQSPVAFKQLGIPDLVRVSPEIFEEMQKGGPSPVPSIPFLTIERDDTLTGEQWELGPKRPSEAQPSAGDAVAPATSGNVIAL